MGFDGTVSPLQLLHSPCLHVIRGAWFRRLSEGIDRTTRPSDPVLAPSAFPGLPRLDSGLSFAATRGNVSKRDSRMGVPVARG